MAGVAIVTDSTAYLSADDVAALGVAVVPLQVVVDGSTYVEGDPALPSLVASAVRAGLTVTTSRPAPPVFLSAYAAAAAAGASAVVSVHVSGQLSGTRDAARLAALESPVPVTVVDSGQVGMGLGFAVLAAARLAAGGASSEEVAAVARSRSASAATLFYVDSLDSLRRGGRIGSAQALVGSALAVKPLLHVVDGRVAMLAKVRTSGRALAELEQRAVDLAGLREVELAIHHLESPDRAAALATNLRARVPMIARLIVTEIGGVIGAHAGPGLLGIVVAPTGVS
ncbi:DegV family protein [Tenggerimyces flavus]|uniref:DegV family protein n=1 Tax=Tenggerimyces flavus TaxID=1708749 RepID=A0ABV7YFX9_9ACTN|nr:DegV family protein [Tenggerimyces flavus]MBM7789293.1 DegV family protein with EDD domain [Tenggerimyces flavus]